MSVETETPLTEAAAAYRTARGKLTALEQNCQQAANEKTRLSASSLGAQANLLAAESRLEEAATDPRAGAEQVKEAAALLKAARREAEWADALLLRVDGELADLNKDRLEARQAAVYARSVLHKEALHGL